MFPIQNAIEIFRVRPIGDDHLTAAVHADLGSLELGAHAPSALTGGAAAAEGQDGFGHLLHQRNDFGIFVLVGIGGVESINVRQQHQ